MKRACLSLAAALLCAGAASAAPKSARPVDTPGDIHFLGADGQIVRGQRCATQPLPPELRRAADRMVSEFQAVWGAATAPVTASIPVWFHVIHDGSEGDVSSQLINAQMDVLNAAFAGSGFSFNLADVTRTRNKKWFNGCYGRGTERKIKQALAVDPANNLNIYTCNPSGGILGYAYLPCGTVGGSYLDGVVLLYSTLPGGGAAPYDEGDTATHEVGHYLGLEHTFENGCNAPGDSVDDTPFEASPAFGCPTGRDTCAQPGPDPITNFMDYTDDACMIEFSPLQGSRMQALTSSCRPSL